ncbi:MAG: SpoIID/LytB domain-containing protein [Luteitalea sp.]|nr:SpoIID/LytB domain-containing protein [Luteitalea sp.]
MPTSRYVRREEYAAERGPMSGHDGCARMLAAAVVLALTWAGAACGPSGEAPRRSRPTRSPAVASPSADSGQTDDTLQTAIDRSAFLVLALPGTQVLASQRLERLDEPVRPGSIAKIVTLVGALEAGVVRETSRVRCSRTLHLPPHDLTCAHPDLGQPLTPADALAHSCNVFFATVAKRLPRAAFNRAALALGLSPISADVDLPLAALGLAGESATPRALLAMMQRLVQGEQMSIHDSTRRVVLEGLRRATEEGTAAALSAHELQGWAKTGTAPGAGRFEGLAVAVTTDASDRPSRGVVVRAPGAAGRDAAAIAAEILARERSERARPNVASARSTDGPFVQVGRSAQAGSVDTLALDDYVAQVVAGEAPPDAPAAALEALAITARTFALAQGGRHQREGFDLCDLTHCQVLRPETASSRAATVRTRGVVLVEPPSTERSLHQVRPAAVFYSASCGGTLVMPADVWPDGQRLEHLREGADPAAHPVASWQTNVAAVDLERALQSAGARGGTLRDLRILARTPAGLVARLGLDGLVPSELDAESFRRLLGDRLGWHILKSNEYDITRTAAGYRFDGRGRGHGIGLCLRGAITLAQTGRSSEQIVETYFPGLVEAGLEDVQVRSGSEHSRDVRIILPAADEQARSRFSALVERTLADLQRQTGQPRPAIVLRVHPTIESFQRATGLAWWTAGATTRRDARSAAGESRAAAVDVHLVPLQLLERRGTLAATLRHELSHALTFDALVDRPLWVREGMAMHFAKPSKEETGGGHLAAADTSCPTETELRRSGSAEALARAQRRALACVETSLDAGTPWWAVGDDTITVTSSGRHVR